MTVFTDDGILMEFAWIVLIYKTAAPNFFGATEPAWCQTIFPRTGLQGVVDENDEIKRYTGIKTNMKYINNSSHHYTELLPYYAVSEAGLGINVDFFGSSSVSSLGLFLFPKKLSKDLIF